MLDVLVTVEDVKLQRDAVWPGRRPVVAPPTERQSRVAENGAACTGSRLCERLGRQHAQREPDVHHVVRQRCDGHPRALDDRHRPTEPLRVGEAVVDPLERPAVEEVGRVHRVPLVAQRVNEAADEVGDADRVVEDDDLGHQAHDMRGSANRTTTPIGPR
jgi:hypothetical protein